jgi:starvation-inducible DNA-binding protein
VLDLSTQTKQAHWNVKGPNFKGLHELFDEIHGHVDEAVDQIAERLVALGGIAEGTARVVAERSTLASADRARDAGNPWCALERGALPAPGISRRLVRALEEGEQHRIGIGCSSDGIIWHKKLAEELAEERRFRLDGPRLEAVRYRVGVRVERGIKVAVATARTTSVS